MLFVLRLEGSWPRTVFNATYAGLMGFSGSNVFKNQMQDSGSWISSLRSLWHLLMNYRSSKIVMGFSLILIYWVMYCFHYFHLYFYKSFTYNLNETLSHFLSQYSYNITTKLTRWKHVAHFLWKVLRPRAKMCRGKHFKAGIFLRFESKIALHDNYKKFCICDLQIFPATN